MQPSMKACMNQIRSRTITPVSVRKLQGISVWFEALTEITAWRCPACKLCGPIAAGCWRRNHPQGGCIYLRCRLESSIDLKAGRRPSNGAWKLWASSSPLWLGVGRGRVRASLPLHARTASATFPRRRSIMVAERRSWRI